MMQPTLLGDTFHFNALQFTNHSAPLAYRPVGISAHLGAHDILVHTRAASVNSVDTLIFGLGSMFCRVPPMGFGSDFAGIVVKTGAKSKFCVGDRVYGSLCDPKKSIGSFSEYIPINERNTLFIDRIPKGMSFEEAASLGVVFSAALQALCEHTGVQGRTVLVVGGGTSVGAYVIQIAKRHFGAETVVATCSAQSMDRVRAYGANKVVDYNSPDKTEAIMEFVRSQGKFDLVVDTVRDQSLFPLTGEIVKGRWDGGIYVVLAGLLTKDYKNLSLSDLLPCWEICKFSKKASWSWTGPRFKMMTISKDQATTSSVVAKMWERADLMVVIDSVFKGKTDFTKAIERLTSFKACGKVVCEF